jgi:hypothetical protein
VFALTASCYVEAANTKFIVFGLNRPEMEPTIGEHDIDEMSTRGLVFQWVRNQDNV